MLLNFLKKYKYSLIMMGIILLALYPLTLFIYVPKWDNINGYLAYRYFISDYLWNGSLPLWNPFQRLGYPGYADLQSGVWNPVVWIIMLFGKYTINSLIVELLSCYIFAGLGMMKLGKLLFKNEKTAFIIGLCYALSGFMVGSSQLMVFLIAVTWFPWIIYCLLNFFETFKLKHQLLAAFFISLFITGASPAYTIVLAYVVVGVFLYQLFVKKAFAKKIILGGTITLVAIIVLTLPYINAFLEFAPYFNRAEGLDYDKFLLANPFTPISYVSFLLPDAIIAQTDWFNITDLSLRNGYFGLLGIFCFTCSFLSKFTRTKTILFSAMLASLILSAGGETFVFEYLYHLPGFGIFRHPSMFRAFTIFCGLILAGYELKIILEEGIQKRHKAVFLIFLIFFTITLVWALSKTNFTNLNILISNIFDYLEFSQSSLSTHILLNSTISTLLLLAFFILYKYTKLSLFWSILVCVTLDLGIHTRISIPTTVCYKFSQNNFAEFFNRLPNGIRQKNNYTPLKKLDETQELMKTDGIWQNVSTYNKTLSYVGVNPMRFKAFDKALEDGRLNKAIENSILYFLEGYNIPDIKVGYNKFEAEIIPSEKGRVLVLNQNYHHLWEATIEGQILEIRPHNNLTMEVEIPANTKGIIEFEYKSPRTKYAVIISLMGYLSIIILLKYKKVCSND